MYTISISKVRQGELCLFVSLILTVLAVLDTFSALKVLTTFSVCGKQVVSKLGPSIYYVPKRGGEGGSAIL